MIYVPRDDIVIARMGIRRHVRKLMKEAVFSDHVYITPSKFEEIKTSKSFLTDNEYLACHIILRSRQLGFKPFNCGMMLDLSIYLEKREQQINRWLKIKKHHNFDIPHAPISDLRGSRSRVIAKMRLDL